MSTMECIPHSSKNLNSALPLELDYIPDELQRRAKTELFEDEETRIHSLRLLRSKLKDETGLVWYDEDWFLLAFLRTRKFDVKRAFHVIKNFYTAKGKRDELYYNFNFDDVRSTVQECRHNIGFLPYRDEEGSVIAVIRTLNWNPHANPLGDIMRALTCGLLHTIRSPATHIAGYKVIVDFNGCSLKHVPHMTPTYILLFAEVLKDAFPGRFRAFHVVNEGEFFSYFWVILKQFLTKKLKDRFHFHGKNVKKLHQFFSPSILPAEYDGELPPFDNSEWGVQLENYSDYFAHMMSQGYEKYRVKSQKKYAAKK